MNSSERYGFDQKTHPYMNFTAFQSEWIQPGHWYQFNYLLQDVNRICAGKPNQCIYYIKIGRPINSTYYWQYSCITVTQTRMKRMKQTATTEKVLPVVLCFNSFISCRYCLNSSLQLWYPNIYLANVSSMKHAVLHDKRWFFQNHLHLIYEPNLSNFQLFKLTSLQ